MRNLNPVARMLVSALVFGGAILIAMYVRDVLLEHHPFTPNWPIVVAGMLLSVVADLIRQNSRR